MKLKNNILILTLFLGAYSISTFSQKLVYSTYLGGNQDEGSNNWLKDFSIDSSGTIYFASTSYTTDFPVTDDAFDKSYNGGSYDWGYEDAVIVKFNIAQNSLQYSSYFGGNGPDFVSSVLFKNNQLFMVGNGGSSNLPMVSNSIDPSFNGPVFRHADGYFARFDSNKLASSTYIGTSGNDGMRDVFVNNKGEIVVVGSVKEWNELPVTHSFSNEKLSENGNACAIRFNSNGDSILSITLLGPVWEMDAAMDSEGFIYIAGTTPSNKFPVTTQAFDTSFNGGTNYYEGDFFVTKLSPNGDQIVFSTYLGGTLDESTPAICLDSFNNVLIYGATNSKDFPISNDAIDTSLDGAKDFFIAKLSNDGKQLLYSSYFGSKEKTYEVNSNIVRSKNGDVYICGSTDADTFPLTPNAIQTTNYGGFDIFITVFDSTLKNIKFSTFFGGKSDDFCVINVDDKGDVIGVGSTNSSDFLTTPGAYDSILNGIGDIIIFKISMTDTMIKTTGIEIDMDTLTLVKGEQGTLSASVIPGNADFKKLNWKSYKTAVATVDNNGLITAKNKGIAIITAQTAEGKHTDTCIVKVTLPVDIDESSALPFTIYPNPTTGIATINFEANQDYETQIVITNLQGMQVYAQTIYNSTTLELDLTDYPTGIYEVMVVSGKSIYRKRIIKI